jgi:hypothetical protein
LPGLPGDYNQNGVVDAADYTVWRDTLGSTTTLTADGSGNGTVDTADYSFWRARFGQSASGSTLAVAEFPGSGHSSVAEPVTMTLASFVLMTFASRRLTLGRTSIVCRKRGTDDH